MFKHINYTFSKASTILLFLILNFSLSGQQEPSVSWDKVVGGIYNENANSIQQTSDGGYIVAGTVSNGNNEIDFWIVKLDVDGSKVWDKTLGGSGYDIANSIEQTFDGSYIIAGETTSNDGDISDGNNGAYDYWVVKLDNVGNIVWDKTLGGSGADYGKSIHQTTDGGYIVAGITTSNDGDITDGNNGGSDSWIVKLDANGNKVWDKTYGGSNSDELYSLQQTKDRGYVFVGTTHRDNGYNNDHVFSFIEYRIVKLDNVGNTLWDKTLGGSGLDRAHSIQQTSDGGYIVVGYTSSNGGDISDGNNGQSDYWVVKLDNAGNKIWDKTLGGSDLEKAYSIQQTFDEGFIIAGNSRSQDGDLSFNNGQTDYWIVKLDGNGNIVWDKTLGGSGVEKANSIQQTSDGGYIIAGQTTSNDGDISDGSNGGDDFWIIKLDGYPRYDIIYNIGNATNHSQNPESYTKLDSIVFKSATKVGQTFIGWYTDPMYNNPITYIPKGSIGDIELWANFEISKGIDELKQENPLIIYPNPANAKIILENNAVKALGKVQIVDVTGKIVKQFVTQKSTIEIDISTLENGIYFVKAGSVSQKLVKK